MRGFSFASPPQSPSVALLAPAGAPGGRGLDPLWWEGAGNPLPFPGLPEVRHEGAKGIADLLE
jgi:hypothetical protein